MSAPERERLLGPVPLVLLLTAVALTLVFLFPRDGELTSPGHADFLSLAYLRVRVRANPADRSARLLLAEQALSLGALDEAEAALRPLGPGPRARMLWFELLLARYQAAPAHERPARQQELLKALTGALADPRSGEELARLATMALSLDAPARAAEIYRRLAERDRAQRGRWQAEAARWLLAAGQPRAAAALFEQAAAATRDRARALELALRALDASRASGHPDVPLVERILARYPADDRVLARALAVFIGAGDIERACQLGRRRLAQRPNEAALLKAQIDLELGARHLPEALAVALRLQPLDDAHAHERLARLADWNGRMELALAEWSWLARRGRRDALDRALALARALPDQEAEAQLLRLRLSHDGGPLTQIVELARKEEELGNTDGALALLRRLFSRPADAATGWRLIAELLERTGDPAGAREAWRHLDQADCQVAQKEADLSWQLGEVRVAFERLRACQPRAAGPDYWRRRAELAWLVDDRAEAMGALEELAAADALRAPEAERLLSLLAEAGRADEALALGPRLWRRFGEPRLLLLTMTVAADRQRWAVLQSLVPLAPLAVFERDPRYWLLRARLDEHHDRVQPAAAAYRRALALDPRSSPARLGVLWLALAADDRALLASLVEELGPGLAADRTFDYPYALALERVGRNQEALGHLARAAHDRPDDDGVVLSYAEALARAGRPDASARLRRFVFARLARDLERAPRSPTRQSLRTLASLAQPLVGLPATRTLALALLGRPRDPEVRALLFSLALQAGNLAEARTLLTAELPVSDRMQLALLENDLGQAGELLADPKLPEATRAEAEERLGHPRAALAATRRALAATRLDPAATASLTAQAERLLDEVGDAGQLTWHLEQMGGLTLHRVEARAELAPFGGLRAFLRPRLGQLGSPALKEGGLEVDLASGVAYAHRRGRAELELGFNWRADSTVPYGRLAEALTLTPRLQARAELLFDELGDESAALRLVGTRSRLRLSLTAQLGPREYVVVSADARQYRDRDFGLLGNGGAVELEVGERLLLARPELRLRLQGSYFGVVAERNLPPGVQAILPTVTSVAELIPSAFALAGFGASVGHEIGPVRLMADLFLGWVGLPSRFAYHLQAGLSARLGPGHLVLGGFYANDRAATAGTAGEGVEVSFRVRFGER